MRIILFVLCLSSFGHAADAPSVRDPAAEAAEVINHSIQDLKSKSAATQPQDVRALAFFGLGVIYYDQSNDVEAQRAFYEAINLGTRLDDYAHYYLGLSLRRAGNFKEAKREFAKVTNYNPTSQRYMDARFQSGEMALQEKDYREARAQFGFLERKTRKTSRYVSVVVNLIRAEVASKASRGVCAWMRKIYMKYPGDPLVEKWGVDLHKVEFEGIKPGCISGPNDLKVRIRNLQLAGKSQKARDEIDTLSKRATPLTKSYVDSILAQYLVTEGRVTEAFKILIPYYRDHGQDYNYLMLIAKAAARAGEYQIASGSYMRAYQLAPGSRRGREALFQAAFQSYQNQDYDGAARKFDEFLKKFSSSGLSRDSRWYLAWISYLKGDYDQAFDKFSVLGRVKARRGRAIYGTDRIDYWRAMSLMKAGHLIEAKKIFDQVAADPLLGYYALAAFARLETLKEEAHKRGIASLDGPKIEASRPAVKGNVVTDAIVPTEGPPPAAVESGEAPPPKQVKSEEDEGEGGLTADTEEDTGDDGGPEGDTTEEMVADGEGSPVKTSFQDPRLTARFHRASDLTAIGLKEWARWELYEIEKRTRNQPYLRMLMSEYENAGAFNRSSSIAQSDFGASRGKLGLDRGKLLWQFSYPKAYEKLVALNSVSFKIPPELVWSIMRAESRYKADVVSPVGAVGLMQLMPYTGERVAGMLAMKGFQVHRLLEPEINIQIGSRYLARLDSKLNRQVPLIAASYNAGPHRVAAWIKSFGKLDLDEFVEHIPYFETRNYVKKVVHNYFVYTHLYNKEAPKTLLWLTQPAGVEWDGPVPTSENWDDG